MQNCIALKGTLLAFLVLGASLPTKDGFAASTKKTSSSEINMPAGCNNMITAYGDGENDDAFLSLLSSSTTSSSIASSVYSGTSGCGDKTAYIDMQQYQFVAAAKDNLAKDIARGSGEYITSMAYLEGCPAETHASFGEMAQHNFSRIYSQSEFDPEVILSNLENLMAADPLLAAQCSEVS